YVENYAGKIRPLSQLFKKEAAWIWTADCQQAFDAVKQGLTEAPILAVADQDRSFHVHTLHEQGFVPCFEQWRQLKLAERNYPSNAIPFEVYFDHASLRTAVKSPHISQRMARWLSFSAEYNFRVEYKPGRLNVVADALSRRPDYAVKIADANTIGVIKTYIPS
ncbi:Reverse transcriptase, partial [Phytophthora palmivora]